MRGLLITLVLALYTQSVVCKIVAFKFDDLNKKEYLDDCGRRDVYLKNLGSSEFDPLKVVGGNVSLVGDHPWQLAMFRNGAFICAASLIDSYCAITAAHCTTVRNASAYSLRRLHNRGSPESWTQASTPSAQYNHEAYSGSTYNNDIAMFCFDKPFDIHDADETKDNVTFPICLPATDCQEKQRTVASGWGSTFSGGSAVTVLREVYFPVTTNAAATAFYGNSYNPTTMIPGAEVGDGLDTCQGDSGGPMSGNLENKDDDKSMGHLKLCGITSWGRGCGNIGVYTRVYNYIDWIRKNHKTFLDSIGVVPEY